MGLDEDTSQHAGLAFDDSSSLIYIEALANATHTLSLAAARISCQLRLHDNVLLLDRVCALLLPNTSFTSAQMVATRVNPLLASVPCEVQVYHGTTALAIYTRLTTAGARAILYEKGAGIPQPVFQETTIDKKTGAGKTLFHTLPYLAFLTNYPSLRLLHLFPYELACRYQCAPIGAERHRLTLATCSLLNCDIITQLRMATHHEIFQVRCEMAMIDEILHYWQTIEIQPGTPFARGQ